MMRMLGKFFGIIVIVASFALGWQMLQYNSFLKTSLVNDDQLHVLEVTQGSSVRSISQNLYQRGYIVSPYHFEALVRLNGKAREIQAGEYQIDEGMLPEALLSRLTSGEVIQYGLTIIEGWSFKQLLQAIVDHPGLVHTLKDHDTEALIDKLGLDDKHPEGWFLPDTYHFPKQTTDVDFLKRAHKAMHAALDEAWQARQPNLPIKTPYEALILASIVEKETGLVSERREIAGVFIRRLKKGMRLQTDPTVIYGMGDKYDGNIRRADLRRDTPYNTYTRKGLPPTPIALPSLDAIKAALNPLPGKTYYFVAKGDGSHYFSKTLKEHNGAVRAYQLRRK